MSSESPSASSIKQEPEVDFICILPSYDGKTTHAAIKIESISKEKVPERKTKLVKGRKVSKNKVKVRDAGSKDFTCGVCLKVYKTRTNFNKHK